MDLGRIVRIIENVPAKLPVERETPTGPAPVDPAPEKGAGRDRMSEQKGYYAPPAAGYGLYLVLRMLWEATAGAKQSGPAHARAGDQRPTSEVAPKPIITPPPQP